MPLHLVSGGARFGVGGTRPLMGQLSSIPTFWGPRFPHEPGPGDTHLSPELGWCSPCVPANSCGCSVSINPLPQGVPTLQRWGQERAGRFNQLLLNPELRPVRPLPAPCLQDLRNPQASGLLRSTLSRGRDTEPACRTPAWLPCPDRGRRGSTLTGQLEEAELAQTARMGLGQGCPLPSPRGAGGRAGASPLPRRAPARSAPPQAGRACRNRSADSPLPGQAGAGPAQNPKRPHGPLPPLGTHPKS